jgi:hypothetical protein
VTQDRVRDDLELLFAIVAGIERGVELTECAHRFFAHLEELLHFSPDATIGDRGEQRGYGCVLWGVGLQTLTIALKIECDHVVRHVHLLCGHAKTILERVDALRQLLRRITIGDALANFTVEGDRYPAHLGK